MGFSGTELKRNSSRGQNNVSGDSIYMERERSGCILVHEW